MKLDRRQFTAVTRIVMNLTSRSEAKEHFWTHEIARLGMSLDDFYNICLDARDNWSLLQASLTISRFDYGEKKYVAALCIGILAADGNIDKDEAEALDILSKACGLPSMSRIEANEYLQKEPYVQLNL